MDNKGLLFIPDISGFTRFVNGMEINHSRLIIQELLEILINSNQMGLEVSEIEGDAVLFYKFGDTPDLEEIYKQVAKMFCEFHKQINAYDHRRFCQCKACTSAVDLTLKVITHYGEFTGFTVKNFNKLFGKDVIIAHRLLKNDIEQHEYWLVTKSLENATPPDFAEWMKWSTSSQLTESGEVPYYYTQLGELKNAIPPEIVPQLDLSNKVKTISLSKNYDADIIKMFHYTGEYSYRSKWQEGVKAVEEVNHFLPRVGTRCKRIMENGEDVVYTTSYSFSPERIEFSECDEKTKNITYYTLEKIDENKTKLTVDLYLEKNIESQSTELKKLTDSFNNSLENLEVFVNSLNQDFQSF